jgi:hypothetical protein
MCWSKEKWKNFFIYFKIRSNAHRITPSCIHFKWQLSGYRKYLHYKHPSVIHLLYMWCLYAWTLII